MAPRDACAPTPRVVVVLVFDGLQSLDAVGPIEVLRSASIASTARGGPQPYEVVVVSVDGDEVTAHSGLRLGVDASVAQVLRRSRRSGGIDTLLVAGGFGVHVAAADVATVRAVRALAGEARRVASVCSGAFLLAAAGLLDGRRATTHWAEADHLAAAFPLVRVEADPIFVRDGDVWTSAGVTAGMDLSLALVADDLGEGVAHDVASWLVMFTRRPGGQSQFSAALGSRPADRRDIADLQAWIVEHPDADLTVGALARRMAMSPRHLARSFAASCGTTPARFVEDVRLERARQLLESSDASVDAVARCVGLSGDAVLHRLFRRRLGTTPASYRAHFARTG